MLYSDGSAIFLLKIEDIQPKTQIFLCHRRIDGPIERQGLTRPWLPASFKLLCCLT